MKYSCRNYNKIAFYYMYMNFEEVPNMNPKFKYQKKYKFGKLNN